MQSAGKRAWKKRLDAWEKKLAMNKNTKTLPSGVRVAGETSASSSKKKVKQAKQLTDLPTLQTITFKGLNGAKCRKWWQETPDKHHVKASIRKA